MGIVCERSHAEKMYLFLFGKLDYQIIQQQAKGLFMGLLCERSRI